MTQASDSKPILIVGGNGKTGRRVAERLTARGIPVRIGSRTGTPSFDWQDQSTWGPALDGTHAAYITYFPDIAIPGAPEAIEIFAKLALAHGVRRLVLLSGRGEPEAQRSEDALIAAGADWTILRCSWFAQNFSEAFLLDFVKAGLVQLPAGNVGEPFIDVDDIADAAVAALTEPGHIGKLYELTGPRLLTLPKPWPRSPRRAAARSATSRSRTRYSRRCWQKPRCLPTSSGCSTCFSPKCSMAETRISPTVSDRR